MSLSLILYTPHLSSFIPRKDSQVWKLDIVKALMDVFTCNFTTV